MSTISDSSYTIGGIDLYFSATIADTDVDKGTTTGVGSDFRTTTKSLGNIVTGELAPDVSFLEHFITTADGDKRKDHMIASAKNLTIPFTFDEMNEANLRRFFLGVSVTASMADAFKVLDNETQTGSAQLYFHTDIGGDLVYMIPKVMLRPDGNLAMNIEDWWTAPMVLDVLYYDWSPTNEASAVIGPYYGIIKTTNF